MTDEQTTGEAVVSAMHAAFARRDVEALVALFTEDATLESYLVGRLFGREDCVCRGRGEIRKLIGELVTHGAPWGGHSPPLVRGNTVTVEYTSAASPEEKFSVDVLELADGKIRSLRAYAGWRAVAALVAGARK